MQRFQNERAMKAFFSGWQRSFASVPELHHAAVAGRNFEVSDKTGIRFTLADQPGILKKALEKFSMNKISLTHIESRPTVDDRSQRAFDFYVDF